MTQPDPAATTALADRPVAALPDELSARQLLGRGQAIIVAIAGVCAAGLAAARLAAGLGPSPLWWAQAAVAVLTVTYVLVIAFKFILVLSAGAAPVIQPAEEECRAVPDGALPLFTVLVPLYREEKILPALIGRLSRLDYPQDRLQVLLLIEEDDRATRAASDAVFLGPQFETVLIPPSQPRTKPKACNLGLQRARGEYCVIYDAEDRPDPDQLRKAAAAFRSLPDWVVCVQAELQYWNPDTNWLTRCFAAEYALNFSLFLRGLDRFQLPMPLGGTSNHFRTDALRSLGAWDPHNVTEDADLGIRIARRGWAVRMMASVTEEEANSKVGNWVRQRSRWIKGYYQTWLVHMRSPWRLWQALGTRRFLGLQATLGMATVTTLVNPVFWALTVVYLVSGPEAVAPLFPAPVLYLGVLAMLGGNLLMVYSLMMGCMERGLYRTMRSVLAVPAYWALMSAAAYKALLQLLLPHRRHYWELTQHGLVDERDLDVAARPTRVPRLVARPAAIAVAGVAIVLAGGVAMTATLHNGRSKPGPMSAAAAAAQAQAAAWIAAQASHGALVGCDPRMCSAIVDRGFPAGDLVVLRSAAGVRHSEIVVSTSADRTEVSRQFGRAGGQLTLARFGSGAARIDILAMASGQATSVVALRADLASRQRASAELLRNSGLAVATAARRQLAAGRIDSRLLLTLATLADSGAVRVRAFGDAGPGASADVPLRSADLAVVGTGANGRVYLHWLLAFLRQQQSPYRAASIKVLPQTTGTIVRIEYSAPVLPGLLAATSR